MRTARADTTRSEHAALPAVTSGLQSLPVGQHQHNYLAIRHRGRTLILMWELPGCPHPSSPCKTRGRLLQQRPRRMPQHRPQPPAQTASKEATSDPYLSKEAFSDPYTTSKTDCWEQSNRNVLVFSSWQSQQTAPGLPLLLLSPIHGTLQKPESDGGKGTSVGVHTASSSSLFIMQL